MTPRPRKVADEEVLAAVARVMEGVGPEELTLSRIAAEAGVTAGALVQRFGSRRGLLLAFVRTFAASAPALFAQLRREHESPLEALRAYAAHHAGLAHTPEALAHHLSWLQLDLIDPDFREQLAAHARDTRTELRRLLEAAVAAGELRHGAPTEALTRAVQAVISGSLFVWAALREGDAAAAMRADLEAVLLAWLHE